MSFLEWHEAWKWLLQLYRELQPEEYMYWQAHYKIICDAPGVTGDDWSVWLAYDVKIRKRRLLEGLDPSIFHQVIWHNFNIRNMLNHIVTATRPMQAQLEVAVGRQNAVSSSQATSASRQAGRNQRSASGRLYPDVAGNSFWVCVRCGHLGHNASSCITKKDGQRCQSNPQKGGKWLVGRKEWQSFLFQI
jgi:hypothetical protein